MEEDKAEMTDLFYNGKAVVRANISEKPSLTYPEQTCLYIDFLLEDGSKVCSGYIKTHNLIIDSKLKRLIEESKKMKRNDVEDLIKQDKRLRKEYRDIERNPR